MNRSSVLRALTLPAVALALVAGAAAVGPAASAAARSSSASRYYSVRSECAAARKGHASCFALRRVVVSANAPGARRAAVAPDAIAAGPAGGYTPATLAKAYGVNAATATTQVVGIVDAYNDPKARADLSHFDAQYGLPAETATSLRIVSQTGSATALPPNDTTGWSGEESLDLDAVRGLCHACKIILVETNSSAFTDLAAGVNEAVKLGATVVSNSYGGTESGVPSASLLAAYNHPGVVITASTGDDGFYSWDGFNRNVVSANAPEVPSSLNTVVAVGGTTLQLNDNGTRSGESVWNENGLLDKDGRATGQSLGATGGGCSTQITAQKWQSSVANYSLAACGTKRLAGDVSALADPYTGFDIYDSYVDRTGDGTGWQTFGGTSLAAPLIAAMWALAGGSGGVTYPSLSLYGHFNTAPGSVYDVTVGGNGFCGGGSVGSCKALTAPSSPNTLGAGVIDCAWAGTTTTPAVGTRACDAATGYDGPSGVGTPTGVTLFKALNPTAVITAPASVVHAKSAAFSASHTTDPFPGATIASYSWAWGDATSRSSGVAPAHTYAKAGTFTVTLTVRDSYGRTGTVTKSIKVT